MSVFTDQITITNTPLTVDGSATTQPVSAASLPLPAGASTSANQTSGNTSLASIDSKTPALVGGRQPVDGSGVTQPISGSVTVSGTVNTITANASTATISQISLATTNQVLLAANANRKKAIIFSATGKTLVALGSAASATNFTYNLAAANSTLEISGWVGSIQAIEVSGTSTVTTTELV